MMNNTIEWLKKSIMLCSKAAGMNSEDRVKEFAEIEDEYSRLDEDEVNQIIEVLEREFSSNDLVYIYSWLCTFVKENSFGKSMLKAMLEGEFELWTSVLFELQAACWIENEWALRYLLRKKNMEKLKEHFDLKLPYRQYDKRNKNEIVIVTEQILGLLHSPSRIVLETIRVLQKDFGYKVTLIVCPTNKSIDRDIWGGYQPLMNVGENPDEAYRVAKWVHEGVEIIYCRVTMDGDFESRYRAVLTLIHQINPLFVYALGVNNPIADMCGQFTTLVNKGMSKKCSISMADILVRIDKCSESEEKEFAYMLSENQTQVFLEKAEPITIDEVKKEYTRQMYDIPKDVFVITIVGNRLDEEIDTDFINMLENITNRCDNIHIAIIGNVDIVKKQFGATSFADRVHYLGFCKELAGTYGVLDLYVNPNRNGGGWSGGIAVLAELPVVTFGNCDVAYQIGDEFVVDGYEDMEQEIVRLATDIEYYKQKKTITRNKKEEISKNGMKEYVADMMDKIIKTIEEKENDTI